MSYRILAEMPPEPKERKLFIIKRMKNKMFFWVKEHKEQIGLFGMIISLFAIIFVPSYFLYNVELKTQQEQRTTIQHWADSHQMRIVSCLNLKGYCECSISNNHSSFIVKVSDNEPNRIFSVIHAENTE